MSGYGASRGRSYKSSQQYNPMGALRYPSRPGTRHNNANPFQQFLDRQSHAHPNGHHHHQHRMNYPQHHTNMDNSHNHNHHHPAMHNGQHGHMNNTNHNSSSLHTNTVSNQNAYNPYAVPNSMAPPNAHRDPHALHPQQRLPDLTQTRRSPQLLTTPEKPKKTESRTKGWDFGAFDLIRSTWNRIRGTPQKPTAKRQHRQSVSQPPPSSLLHNEPPNENPYAVTPDRASLRDRKQATNNTTTSNNIQPELSNLVGNVTTTNTANLPANGNQPQAPSTPPTAASLSTHFQSQQKHAMTEQKANIQHTPDDDQKSANTVTTGGGNENSLAVISIYNLLQNTTLSPVDARWLQQHIDMNTRGSQSCMGLPRGNEPKKAGSVSSVVQLLHFDDGGTMEEEPLHTQSHSAFSPSRGRQNNGIHSARTPRYIPHPGGYHIPSSSVGAVEVNGKHGVVTLPNRKRRKRARQEMLNDHEEADDDDDIYSENGYKRRKFSHRAVKRKAFKSNYLKPYPKTKFSTPQHLKTTQRTERTNLALPGIHDVDVINEDEEEEYDDNHNRNERKHSDKKKQQKNETEQAEKDKMEISGAEKSGFSFVGGNKKNGDKMTVNTVSIFDDEQTANRKKSTSPGSGYHGFGSHTISEQPSEESSENVVMSNKRGNSNHNKPLKKRRKSNTRSPLKDTKVSNHSNTNSNTNNKSSTMRKNDDDDEDMDKDDKLKDIDEDDEEDEDLKKQKQKSLSKSVSPTTKKPVHETPISEAFNKANELILSDKLVTKKKKTDTETKRANKKQKNDALTTTNTTNNKESPQRRKSATPKSETPKITAIPTDPPSSNSSSPPKSKSAESDKSNPEKKDENDNDKAKEAEQPQVPYLVRLMRERKKNYLKLYRQRLERIYEKYKPENKNKVEGFLQKFGGDDADKLHELYTKICTKYELEPYCHFDGNTMTGELPVEQMEQPKLKSPVVAATATSIGTDKQPTSETPATSTGAFSWNTTNDDKKNDDTTLKINSFGDSTAAKSKDTPFSFGAFNTSSNDKDAQKQNKEKEKEKKAETTAATSGGFTGWGFGQTEKPKSTASEPKKATTSGWDFGTATAPTQPANKDKPAEITFSNAANPFANTQTEKKSDDANKTAVTSNGLSSSNNSGWGFGVNNKTDTAPPATPSQPEAKKSKPETSSTSTSWAASSTFNTSDNKFQIPSNFSFSGSNAQSENKPENGKTISFASTTQKSTTSISASNAFSSTNSSFAFTDPANNNKPQLSIQQTDVIDDNANQKKAKNGWSFGSNGTSNGNTSFPWTASSQTNTENNKTNDASKNNTFSWNPANESQKNDSNKTGNNNNAGFPWNNNNKGSVFGNANNNDGNNNNNKGPAFNTPSKPKANGLGGSFVAKSPFSWDKQPNANRNVNNNGGSNTNGGFSWNVKKDTNGNNNHSAFGANTNNTNGGGGSSGNGWTYGGSSEDKASTSGSAFNTNNGNMSNSNNGGQWSFNPNNNLFQNNNNSSNQNPPFGQNMNNTNNSNVSGSNGNSTGFQFQPTGPSAGSVDGKSFFNTSNKPKRKVFRAKRRNTTK